MKITLQHVDGLRFLATVGEHAAIVDAAREEGGTGTAPSAPQLFALAVGACICEFVVNSCRLRDVPCERLSLELSCEEVPRPRRLGALEVTLHVEPEPAEDAKRRLIGVARHATLVNTFAHPPEVIVRFAEDGGTEPHADL